MKALHYLSCNEKEKKKKVGAREGLFPHNLSADRRIVVIHFSLPTNNRDEREKESSKKKNLALHQDCL